ncbi:MAG: TIGR04211 family SH3 domain-containing protein [Desulfuromonadales bacterium]|nr:TIGR04211 family SH3 domain-containing protein [Desulfuromonadales bacterium]
MIRLPFFCGLLLVWSAVFPAGALAERLYVSDRLVVSLRVEPQANAAVVTFLRSDQPVQRLEEKGDFLRVRTAAGETGYVQRQYLTESVPKAETIRQLEARNRQLAERIAQLEKASSLSTGERQDALRETTRQLEEARRELTELAAALQRSDAEVQRVSDDYRQLRENSGRLVEIVAERDDLQQQLETLQASLSAVATERDELLKKGAIKWFLAGAAVLLFGWLIGKASASRRRSSWL